MALTYEVISTTTLTVQTAGITFSSIPQTYTDLRVVAYGAGSSTSVAFRFRANGITTNGYAQMTMIGDGANASSTNYANSNLYYLDAWGGTNLPDSSTLFNFCILDILGYTDTSCYKPLLSHNYSNKNGTAAGGVSKASGQIQTTSAITSVNIFTSVATLQVGTTVTLFGIKGA